MRHDRLAKLARTSIALTVAGGLVGCVQPNRPQPVAAIPDQPTAPVYDARVSGSVGSPNSRLTAQSSLASASEPPGPDRISASRGTGDIMLNFADTDIRDVIAQILGMLLKVNYTIDPAVTGTVTLRTVAPINRDQLIPTLQTLLAQSNATLVQNGDFYRVLPIAAAAGAQGIANGVNGAGSSVVKLRYAAADDLARVLQPFVASGGRIQADPGRNALVISGDPGTRQTLTALIQAFDIDTLAGQSYALLPVADGDAKDFATALQDALNGKNPNLANSVRVVPMQRLNAVLVVAPQPRLIDDVRRVYSLVDRARRENIRVWHVFYLQNSRSNDIAYVLQQAFTPNHVTAQPTPSSSSTRNANANAFNNSGRGSSSGGGGLQSGTQNNVVTQQAVTDPTNAAPNNSGGTANAVPGALDQSNGGGEADSDTMRIIPNPQNNALLVYGTASEQDTVEATLRKLDILPLQVRIDAVIAEVDLNDSLQFGTQFFFRGNGLAGALGTGTAATAISSAANGFVFGSSNGQSALEALQSVTKVRVLSSPQLLVLDNENAHLQVGNIVPYLTQSSQSTLVTGSPVINSIDYRDTGVIMDVTPRVNSGGLVTLDISQEVSGIDNSATSTTTGIDSPTFTERAVRSRVVIQDGQTVGLAGLISDNDSTGNSGIPWLKDVPILGLLAGQQNNVRTRTELLVMITPHVIHDQRDARALTEDLRDQMNGAALVPSQLRNQPASGSADPSRGMRRSLGLQAE